MRTTILHWKRVFLSTLIVLLLCVVGVTKVMAQQLNQTKLTEYNFHNLGTIEERVFLLHSIQESEFFSYVLSNEEGKIDIYVSDDYTCQDGNANSDFDLFLEYLYDEWIAYSNLDKTERGSLFVEWRYQLEDEVFLAINEDFHRQLRNGNSTCDGALEFSSILGVCQFPASVNAGNLGVSQTVPYYCSGFVRPNGGSTSCLSTTPNPAFYYMQIAEPGNLNIYMYSTPSYDIDFDCWGPFDDIETACSQLSCSKMVDCSYSASATENCYINNAQSGQYYILLITNYSNQSSTIYFENIGTGSTGCNGQKTVTANVHPNGGGRVTGAGVYDCGSSCTLTAIANVGYTFMDWTDNNGVVVSTDAEYTFDVWGNRSFTANFVEDNACYLTFNLNDSNGDGWSGNYLVLNFEDGSYQKLKIPYGLSSFSYSLPITDGSHVSLGWISGTFTDQCSFIVSYSNGNGIYYSADLNDDLNYEFDVDCVGMPAMFYTITATANPSTGGTISCNTYTFQQNITYDFEDGFPDGWTTIDADGDGFNWMLGSTAMGTGYGHNGSSDLILSKSYDNNNGALTPDNYLVSPVMTFTNSSNFSFYACAQDNAFSAEHFGVAVSVGSNTNPSDFQIVQEWTMTAKGVGAPTEITRSGNRSQGPWHQYTIDLGAYAGQIGYVAIRHFNCTDWFYLDVDDITINNIGIANVPSQYNTYSFGQGETCTMRAFPNTGYTFENWKENGNVISTDAEFSFIVNSNRNLEANFTKVPLTITAIPNFDDRGTVSGAGEYLIDDTCTLIATANAGFAFANWTKDGAIVSTDAEYTFIVENEATFVANFVPFGNIVFADANVKSICITQWDTNGDGELSYVEAAAVTDLGNYFQGNTGITSFNELQYFIGLSSIGSNAFKNCSGLIFITLPNSITSIGNSAFYGCNGWTGLLNLPSALTTIGSYAFYNCSGLIGGLTIPNTVNTIGDYAFSGCSGFMGLLTIGNSVTTIGNYAFQGCINFTGSINIPNSVITIGSYAFQGCTAFWGTLTIGNSVSTIGSYAFSGCTGLVGNIVIPSSVASIGNNAFYDCHSFAGTLTIGNSVTSIGSSAFYNCYGLTGNLVIPNTVTSIGSSAFYNCSGFTGTLTIGNSVTSIGSSAFRSCSNLVGNIGIPHSVTTIGSEAFYYCNSFNGSLTIPSSVTTIGSRAFYYCSGLSEVYYNVTNHADINEGYYNYPFEGCGGHLNIGSNVIRIASNIFRNANFTGMLTIPNSVVAINDNAFNNCWHFTGTLVIPNSINTIGISAFQDCDGLSEIIMGNNVMIVGNTAFYSCSGLTKVTLPEPVTVIGIEAFRYCTQLNEVNMQSTQAPSIGWDVFSNNATGRIINIPCGAAANYADGYWSEWTDALNEMCDDYAITVEVNPSNAGSVTGAGYYYYSQMCTLTATGNLGYPFLNWTKNGVIVSTEPTYSFGVTESCTYVANFSPTPVSYDITVAANLEEGGTVTGAGSYLHGATVTLTAMANEGYSFINWTKNNMVISTSPTYSFIITEAGSYIANFELNTYEITATANPSEGGIVNGAGTYNYASTCTLTATANEGYTFANWTEDGVKVSTNANYSFIVTDNHDLVANFFPNYHWNVDIYQYPYTMSVTGIIRIYGEEQAVSSLEIGAFCGDVCRGTQRLTYYPQVDRYLVFLTLYGDAGDVMSFRLYDNSLGEELDLGCISTISFVPDGFVGTPFDPYVFDFGNMTVEQVSNFSQGYNWWSTCIEQEGINGLGILQEGLGSNGVTIRSQASGYTDYYQGYGWYGSLSSLNNESSYRVITSAPCTVTMTGSTAVPSQHPITLSQGWTWIGYVPSTAMSVDAAMANVNATSGDKLKSQQGYADYYAGYGWFGSLNTIEQGMGLMYYSANSATTTFTYPDSNRGGELKANLTSENNHWVPNIYAYPDNMTVMAVVELDDMELTSDNYELAAFAANGECRGSVRLSYAEPLHRHVAFLTIAGKDAAELSFRLYDTETNVEYYDAEESLDFVADAIVGEATDLYTIHFRGAAVMDEFASRVKVYPNPVNRGERVSIGMKAESKSPVHVEIVNALGAVVSEETSTQAPVSIVAPVTAGVYTLRITVEGKGMAVRKLVVK